MTIIAVSNQKGGVGKTTIAFNLAQILATKRLRVLAVDNDPQGNLTSSFLENPGELKSNILDVYDSKDLAPMRISRNLYFIGANISLSTVAERGFQVVFNLKEALDGLRKSSAKMSSGEFDYVIIDSLPSFGHLHLAALTAADYVIIPVKPAPYALAGLKDLVSTIQKAKKYFNPSLEILGIVINQVDGRNLIMERAMETTLRETYKGVIFKTRIRKRVSIEESPAFQKSIAEYAPESPPSRDFDSLTKEILNRIKCRKRSTENGQEA